VGLVGDPSNFWIVDLILHEDSSIFWIVDLEFEKDPSICWMGTLEFNEEGYYAWGNNDKVLICVALLCIHNRHSKAAYSNDSIINVAY